MSAAPNDAPVYRIADATFAAPPLAPGLYLVATPIGNLRDVTIRALETLAAADLVLCEDTRVTARLLERYAIANRLKPYHDHNAAKVRPGILRDLEAGRSVALVSDAGSPLVSDPGFKLVETAIAAGHRIEALPGPSASLAALSLSGLPSDRFLFAGFLPPKAGDRLRLLAELKPVHATLIFFESPGRLAATLAAIADVLGNRPVAVARELTKIHEEVVRGPAAAVERIVRERMTLKGEVTLIVAPPPSESDAASDDDIHRALGEAMRTMSASAAAAHVADELGVARRRVYGLAVARKDADAD